MPVAVDGIRPILCHPVAPEALPYRHGVHPPMPSTFALCHANRRCQRIATATKRRRIVNAASSARRRRHEAALAGYAVVKAQGGDEK